MGLRAHNPEVKAREGAMSLATTYVGVRVRSSQDHLIPEMSHCASCYPTA